MHDIEPFFNWEKYYNSHQDERSPFYGVESNYMTYENNVYGYYIHPDWDFIESETLYLRILYTNYHEGYTIIELIGEWNDTLHNDIMFLKRNVVDHLVQEGITKFILLGEHVMNFHGLEDDYYAEWSDDTEDGWIVALNFREHVLEEWQRYRIDYYINFGGTLEIDNWRTMPPQKFFAYIQQQMQRRLGPAV